MDVCPHPSWVPAKWTPGGGNASTNIRILKEQCTLCGHVRDALFDKQPKAEPEPVPTPADTPRPVGQPLPETCLRGEHDEIEAGWKMKQCVRCGALRST